MLLTLSEARTAFGSTSLTDEALMDTVAAFSRTLESLTNRVFAKRVSDASGDGTDVEFTLTQHQLKPDDKVSIRTSTGDANLDGIHTVKSITRDRFKIESNVADGVLNAIDDITVRPVRVGTFSTRKTHSLFLYPRPVAEIVSVKRAGTYLDSNYDDIDATKYTFAESMDGLSYSGELTLIDGSEWPGSLWKNRQLRPAGAVIEFVAGEPFVPPDAVYCVEKALKDYRQHRNTAGMQSESNEGYSYSRMSASDARQFFSEVQSTIGSLYLPGV